MKKSLIALAVASAISSPAFAATSNVDIYGQLDVSVDRVSGLESTTATPLQDDNAWRLSSNTSRIGLKGSEDLGGGLAAIWQWENTLALDGAGLGGLRNTFLGLKGNWGTLLGGTHDTPYKLSTASLDPFADSMGDYNTIIGSFAGVNSSDLRLGNVLAYISPSFSGLTGAIATSFMKESGAENPLAPNGSPSAWSAMVNYANGPLYLAAGYEKADNQATTIFVPSNLDIRSWKLGAGYKFGNFAVNAIYDNIKVSNNTTASEAKRSAWGLNGVYNMGNIALKAGYYNAGKVSGTGGAPDTGATLWELGADYMLSKRTKLYALYAKVNNDTNGTYSVGGAASAGFGSSGVSSAVSPGALGGDPSAFSLGMRHTF